MNKVVVGGKDKDGKGLSYKGFLQSVKLILVYASTQDSS